MSKVDIWFPCILADILCFSQKTYSGYLYADKLCLQLFLVRVFILCKTGYRLIIAHIITISRILLNKNYSTFKSVSQSRSWLARQSVSKTGIKAGSQPANQPISQQGRKKASNKLVNEDIYLSKQNTKSLINKKTIKVNYA